MRTALLMCFLMTACATSERTEVPAKAACPDAAVRTYDPMCRVNARLDEAEHAQRNRREYFSIIQDARSSTDAIADPGVRVYLHLRIALIESAGGGMYTRSLNEARADAAQIRLKSERERARENIARTERVCANQAADFHMRTALRTTK